MRINAYSSEQFAGMRDHNVKFSPGMNVVLGNNEAGKSTMIAALFHALTKPIKIDGRSDKEFISRNFPSGGAKTIDAKVCFSENEKEYTVEKIWDQTGQDATFKLRGADIGVARSAQAEGLLKELLRYGPAVYDNLIFGRQDHEEAVLAWCYRFFADKSSTEIDSARKQIGAALSAAAGVSPEKFLAEISKRMNELGGRWDFDRDGPEKNRGLTNPWANNVGTILKAWYEYQRADQKCREAVQTEQSIAAAVRKLDSARKERNETGETQRRLLEQKGVVDNVSNIKRLKEQADRELQKAIRAQAEWPGQTDRIKTGKELLAFRMEDERRKEKAAVDTRIAAVTAVEAEITALTEKLQKFPELAIDHAAVKELPHKIDVANAKLNAAKLHASIRMKNGCSGQLLLASGESRSVCGDVDTDLSGFFQLDIPDVAEIQVAPQDLDVKGLQAEIERHSQELNSVLKKYGVSDISALAALSEDQKTAKLSLEQKKRELERELAGENKTALQERAVAIVISPNLSIPENLDSRIKAFLNGAASLDAAISVAQSGVESYEAEYGDQELLRQKIDSLKVQTADYEAQIIRFSAQSLISVEEFERKLRGCKTLMESLDAEIGELQNELGRLGEPDDPAELESERDRLEDEWRSLKQRYANYQRIKADFESLQDREDDRFSAFHSKFNEYLSAITGDTLSMEDNNGLALKSGRNQICQPLLSAGTRKTLLLAFRLAVLSYYFPNGDSLIVLDDDLLDMDPDRRRQAALLLNRFAEKNQVIFTTCDPAVAELLGGNLIRM